MIHVNLVYFYTSRDTRFNSSRVVCYIDTQLMQLILNEIFTQYLKAINQLHLFLTTLPFSTFIQS